MCPISILWYFVLVFTIIVTSFCRYIVYLQWIFSKDDGSMWVVISWKLYEHSAPRCTCILAIYILYIHNHRCTCWWIILQECQLGTSTITACTCIYSTCRTWQLTPAVETIVQSLQPHEKMISIVLSKNPYILGSFPYKHCMHPSINKAHYICTRTHLREASELHGFSPLPPWS